MKEIKAIKKRSDLLLIGIISGFAVIMMSLIIFIALRILTATLAPTNDNANNTTTFFATLLTPTPTSIEPAPDEELKACTVADLKLMSNFTYEEYAEFREKPNDPEHFQLKIEDPNNCTQATFEIDGSTIAEKKLNIAYPAIYYNEKQNNLYGIAEEKDGPAPLLYPFFISLSSSDSLKITLGTAFSVYTKEYLRIKPELDATVEKFSLSPDGKRLAVLVTYGGLGCDSEQSCRAMEKVIREFESTKVGGIHVITLGQKQTTRVVDSTKISDPVYRLFWIDNQHFIYDTIKSFTVKAP